MSSSAITSVRRSIAALFATRATAACIVVLGLLLTAPSLDTGLSADDYLHAVTLRRLPPVGGVQASPLDLFRFADGKPESARALMDAGEFPWTTDPTVRLWFFRPLTALTHVFDYAAWPDSPWLMHAHNLAWFAVALAGAAAFYRRFLGATGTAGLALLLFAVDDAHGPTVGWIANRNSILALALALPVLVLHDRWRRDGQRWAGVLAPLLLGAALLAGESALAGVAYLAAHALHLEEGSWRARVKALAPYAAVLLVWRLGYGSVGYGAAASGVYFDPGHEPGVFLRALPVRFPLLLLGQLALPWSDFAPMYPFLSPTLERNMVLFACGVLGVIALLVAPLWRQNPTTRFFATGLLLATLPICCTFTADRLLMFVGVGAMGVVAQQMATARGWAGAGLAALFAVVHIGLAPPLLAIRSRSMATMRAPLELVDVTIPREPSIADKTVILVDPPGDVFGAYLPAMRRVSGTPIPRHIRVLASGTSPLTVTREDTHTIRVRPEGGFLEHDTERLLRRAPLPAGSSVDLTGMRATVTASAPDGRPLEARFRFDAPLDDPSLVWMHWEPSGYVPFVPPPVGATVTLPARDFLASVFGAEARLRERGARPPPVGGPVAGARPAAP